MPLRVLARARELFQGVACPVLQRQSESVARVCDCLPVRVCESNLKRAVIVTFRNGHRGVCYIQVCFC
jgi:hypothetical protein